MIQLQALNNILENNNLEEYLSQGIDNRYFSNYQDEFNFIKQHHLQYNKVPDMATFLSHFVDFEVVEVLEPLKYII